MTNTISQVQNMLNEWVRKKQFQKANLKREEAIDLQNTLGKCRGMLERSAIDLKRTIRVQCKNIKTGREAHQDTLVQEQILWDAALAYMLIRDAIYALKTVNSYDSVCHANEMLDAAMSHMTGKKSFKIKSPFAKKTRNAYGYITSETAVQEKEQLLDSFFADLKNTGDIDACLMQATYPADREAETRYTYTKKDAGSAPKSERDRVRDIFREVPDDDKGTMELDPDAMDAMSDIH